MRKTENINGDWTLKIKNESMQVDLPHTWNAVDGQNEKDYFRGQAIYSKIIPQYEGNVFLEINAANTKSAVYINGCFAAKHNNGYGMYRVDITNFLTMSQNALQIYVDNTADPLLYPQVADFTFYGGIYRDVNMISSVSDTRFAMLDKSRTGIYITPKNDGSVYVKSVLEGSTRGVKKHFAVLDAKGKTVAEQTSDGDAQAVKLTVSDPVLWQGRKNPYLYTLVSQVIKNDTVIDEVKEKFGFREYYFDSEKGFFLNGEHLKLKGVSRHQDRENIGNALTLKEHREDIELICEAGANSVRLAHYQQSPDFYDLCDEKGLLVWAEIPVISRFSAKKQAQARLMLEELIKQNYNHPSIYCWGIENEISMTVTAPGLVNGISELNDIAHRLDGTRPTTCAQISFAKNDSRLNRITDIMGYNHYFGWYMQTADEIEHWLDRFHEECPDIKLCLSEYGAEGITSLHSENPVQGDYSEEYQAVFHEKYLSAINKREWLWGSYVWNMFDFGSAARNEGGVKGRNNKGLVTIDRKIKKDSFWLYKAYWSDEKFVHITGERFVNRVAGVKEIKVYSSCESVTLSVNGKEQTVKGDKIFIFKAEILPGENILRAAADGAEHTVVINGVDREDESCKLGEGQGSFVRNWFEAGDEINGEKLSLNDTLGEIVNNAEVQSLMKNYIGKSVKIPSAVGKIPLKQVSGALAKTKKGKELTDFANRYLQTIRKD
ncbi:MAG: hypothetical protein MJ177_09085 [Clostridia bacterium]|nr:hypothetical protein [Clostridia bacterium]